MKDKFGYQTGRNYFSSSVGVQVNDPARQFTVYGGPGTQRYFDQALAEEMRRHMEILTGKEEVYEDYDIRSVTQKIKNKQNTEWVTLMGTQNNQLKDQF